MPKTIVEKHEISLKEAIKTTEKFQKFFEDKKRSVIIMFVDMVGSTAYKHDHSIFDGLRKVIRHNDIITDIVTRFEGQKVKEIGDEVMVYFDCDKGEAAINAAIEIQEAFNNINIQEKREGSEKIESQIGIGYGKDDALLLEDKDIHGTPVDVAKRLVAIAKPTQILINGDLENNIKKDKITSKYLEYAKNDHGINIGPANLISEKPAKRKVKGIKGEIDIYEIRWSSNFLGVKDKDRLASEWKKTHECLTEMLPHLDRLKTSLNNIVQFKEEWSELKGLYGHPYKKLVNFFCNSMELQYDETGKDKDGTGKEKMNLLEKAYEEVDEELKKTKSTDLPRHFKIFSMEVMNFLTLADRRLKERFDIEEDK